MAAPFGAEGLVARQCLIPWSAKNQVLGRDPWVTAYSALNRLLLCSEIANAMRAGIRVPLGRPALGVLCFQDGGPCG
eukprot:1161347-Pelagomonas_calceolata.AAC.1